MSTATSGRAREHKARNHMISHGWEHIMRAAGSKGCADLLMAHEEHGAALVQVGAKSKYLSPADRERLCRAAWLCSALPIVVTVVNGVYTYAIVNTGPPAGWAKWWPGITCHGHLGPEQYCPECGAYNPEEE